MAKAKAKTKASPRVKAKTEKRVTVFKRVPFGKKAIFVLVILVLGSLFYYARGFFWAARVNGKHISRLSVVRELERRGGSDVLQELVSKELIFQEGRKQEIEVSDEVVDSEIKLFEERLGIPDSGQSLDDVLSGQGLTRDDLIEQIKIQKIAEAALGDQLDVSEEELDEYIAANEALLGEDTPPEEAKEIAREQLKATKFAPAFQAWLTALQDTAKVDYLIEY